MRNCTICRMQKKSRAQEDPFKMRPMLSAHHTVLGDQVQSRDSYLKSNHQDRDRWWKARPKYSSVSTQDESLSICCIY